MALTKLTYRPGINKENTNYSGEGGWWSCDKVRFRSGFPEKIGGWIRLSNSTFLGVARSLWNWATLAGLNLLGVGTNLKYYIENGGTYNDITPIREVAVLTNPFTATSGSKVITVTDAAHGCYTNDFVTFSGATSLGGNITASVLNQEYQVTVINGNTYTITASVAANASDTGHGGATVSASYQINTGLNVYTTGVGWGAGTWPQTKTATLSTNPFTTVSSSGTVTVSQTAHGMTTGDIVIFRNATSFAGLPTGILNKSYQITVTTANAYTISLGNNGYGNAIVASSSTSGGGDPTVYMPYGTRGWGEGTTVGIGQQLRIWTNDNFGQDLIIAPRGGQIYYWQATLGTGTRAVYLSSLASSSTVPGTSYTYQDFVPNETNQIISSSVQRFVIAFGANTYDPTDPDTAFNPLLVRWSDQEDPFTWVPDITNQSGEQLLTTGSYIVCAKNTRQEILIWTDAGIYSMQYLGPPFVWGFNLLQDNISIMGPNTAITVNNITYWMGTDKFFMYSGRVETLPCTVRQYVFQNLNHDQAWQCFAASNEQYSEVWWFYPSTNSTTVDSYVVFNYLDKVWYYGSMARTAWLDSGIRQYPMGADYNGRVLYHENGVDDVSGESAEPIVSYIQSSDFDIGDGHNFGFVWRILPDLTFSGSTAANPQVTMTVKPRRNSGTNYGVPDNQDVIRTATYPVEEFTGQVYVRIRGRQMAFRIDSTDLGVAWQLGSPRIDIRADGRR